MKTSKLQMVLNICFVIFMVTTLITFHYQNKIHRNDIEFHRNILNMSDNFMDMNLALQDNDFVLKRMIHEVDKSVFDLKFSDELEQLRRTKQ